MDGALEHRYQASLKWTLDHRWPVMGFSVAFFAVSLVLLTGLRQELIPAQDQALFLLNMKAPVGTSIQAADARFKKAEAFLKSQPEVEDYYTTIGNYQGNDIVNAGNIYVILKDVKSRKAASG